MVWYLVQIFPTHRMKIKNSDNGFGVKIQDYEPSKKKWLTYTLMFDSIREQKEFMRRIETVYSKM